MNERDQITYMQVRITRKASEKWNVSMAEAARIFHQYQVFEYIRDCFVLKIPQIVPQLLHHPVTEQINSLSSAAPGASSLPLAC